MNSLSPSSLPNGTAAAESKKRPELSFCNVLFCLFVIFIHLTAEPVTLYRKDSLLFPIALSLSRCSSFVVQGFIFLSGVKLFLRFDAKKFSYPRFALSRLRRVVLPYALTVAAFALVYVLLGWQTVDTILPTFLRGLFLGDLAAHFYFVVIICQFYLLMPLWRRMAVSPMPVLPIAVSLLLMVILKQYTPELLRFFFGVEGFPHTGRLFTSYLFYFVLGIFCGREYDAFLSALRQQKKAVLLGWIVTALINCVFMYLNSTGRYYALWLENFHILYCIFSILLSLLLCDLAAAQFGSGTGWLSRAVKATDRCSYEVYLLHPLVILAVDRLMDRAEVLSVSLRYGVRTVVVYAVCLGACILWDKLRKKGEG